MKTIFPFKTNRSLIYLFGLFTVLAVLTLSSCLKDSDNDDSFVSGLTVVHASPDTPPLDFVLDNQRVNNQEFAYGSQIKYFLAFSGNRLARFYQEGTNSDAIYQTQVNLIQGKFFSLFLSGPQDDLSSILIEDDATVPDEGNAKIRFVNLSPDAGSLDFQLVDDSLAASDKDFEEYTAFQQVDAGDYTAKIKSHDGNNIDHQFTLTLKKGVTYTIWAKGFATDAPDGQAFNHGVIEHYFE